MPIFKKLDGTTRSEFFIGPGDDITVGTDDIIGFRTNGSGRAEAYSSGDAWRTIITGPATNSDNVVPRFSGIDTGVIQGSLVTISDTGSISIPVGQTVDGRDISEDGSALDSHISNTSIHFADSTVLHNNRSDLQGGTTSEYYHLTASQHTDLTDAGDSLLHYHASDRDRANHTGTQAATTVELREIGTATYDDIQDWSDSVQSAGVISGGEITDGGSGTINISAVTGIIKSTNSPIADGYFFDLGAATGLSLTDDATNYVYIDYNSGTPQFGTSTSNIENGHTIFNLGKVFREGTSLDIITSGLRIYDLSKRIQQHHIEEADLHFVSGAVVGATGTRNISISSGVLYAGLNRSITDAIDTAVADTFEYYYYNGSTWIESDQTQIDNTQYNDTATGLSTLSNNRYGVHWVYKGSSDKTYVIYGQGDYTLIGAEAAQPPSSLPGHVENFGVLRAKIIIEKNATSFLSIESVTDTIFMATAASNHNELSGLQGGVADQYYHLTSAQHTIATQAATSSVSGYLTSTDWSTFNSKLTDPMTTEGDLIYRSSGGTTRLPIGGSGQYLQSTGTTLQWNTISGGGDVVGPSSATDNALARYNGATGKLIQNSSGTLDDSGYLSTSRYYLSLDLSLIPIAGGQSVITTWHGMQLVGNKQSTVAYTPTNVGTANQFGVLVPSQDVDADASFAVIGASAQTGDLVQLLDNSLNTLVSIGINGNIYSSSNGSTTADPRVIGFNEFSTGEATRFSLDVNDGLQTTYGGSMTLYSYNTLVLRGSRNDGPPDFDADLGVGVAVIGETDEVSFVVRQAASQTVNTQEWQTSAGGILTAIDDEGNLVFGTAAAANGSIRAGNNFEAFWNDGTSDRRIFSGSTATLFIGQDTGTGAVTTIDFESATNQTWSLNGATVMELSTSGLDLNNNAIIDVQTVTFNQWGSVTASGSAAAVAFDDYQQCTVDLNDQSSCTVTLNVPDGPGGFKLILVQGSTTPSTITWATEGTHALYAPSGTLTVAPGAGERTIIGLWYDGTDWHAVSSQPMETVVAS